MWAALMGSAVDPVVAGLAIGLVTSAYIPGDRSGHLGVHTYPHRSGAGHRPGAAVPRAPQSPSRPFGHGGPGVDAVGGRLEMNDLLGYAAELGLDVHTFREDLRRRIHGGRIGRDIASADRSGVSGTPTFFFNGQRHTGAHDPGALTRALDAAREGAEHACLRPEPKAQLCVLRLAVRRYRTRAQHGPIRPGRAGRRTTDRASGRPAPGRLRPVGQEGPRSRADAP
ncbi:DsbA family protein [Streptomyces olivaceoviridis]